MVIILERPNFPPYVCLTCGVSTGRKWFVSLDWPLDTYFNPVNEGIIFQCNECWESLATTVAREAQRYMIGQDPWKEGDYVAPSYDNEKELVKEVSFGRQQSVSTIPALHSGTTEPSNTEPTGSDTKSDTTDTNVPEDSELSEFRVFFGDGGDKGTTA